MTDGARFTERKPDGTLTRRSRRHLTEGEEMIYWLVQALDAAAHVATRYHEPDMRVRAAELRLDLRAACVAFLAEPVVG